MKNFILGMAFAGTLALCAEDVATDFDKAQIGAASIPGWTLNFAERPNIGKGMVVAGRKEGSKAFKIVTTKEPSTFYKAIAVPAKAGDTLIIRASISGKGKITFGHLSYVKKGNSYGYISVRTQSETFDLTPDVQDVECKLVVTEAQGKDHVGGIRPTFRVEKDSEAVLQEFTIQHIAQ